MFVRQNISMILIVYRRTEQTGEITFVTFCFHSCTSIKGVFSEKREFASKESKSFPLRIDVVPPERVHSPLNKEQCAEST